VSFVGVDKERRAHVDGRALWRACVLRGIVTRAQGKRLASTLCNAPTLQTGLRKQTGISNTRVNNHLY